MRIVESRAPSHRRRVAPLVSCVVLVAAVGALWWFWGRDHGASATTRAQARPAVPVSIATVGRQDVPVYLSGLGVVQASFTVGIHSQVDGKLQEVQFTEGQHVKKGDVLARIDPR